MRARPGVGVARPPAVVGDVGARVRTHVADGVAPDEQRIAAITAPDGARLGTGGLAESRAALGAELLGLGPLEPWLADPAVTDLLVNGDGVVWVDRGDGVVEVGRLPVPGELAWSGAPDRPASTDPAETTRRLAVRLAGLAGRRLDDAQPWVDGLLPGGIRLHALLPPLVEGGAHLSLRVPRRAGASLADLAASGMLDARTEAVLAGLVRHRVSLVVTGGTGSGKTTLLGALLAAVPHAERVVLVEDVRELSVAHPHVVRLQGRAPNVEGHGEVRLDLLVRQALRMRPDRLVVGEVRGGEVRELLAALNTGHDGGAGTLHANRPQDLPARFEALGALAGMPREAVQTQLASAVRAVVHVARTDRRRVESVSMVISDAGRVRVEPAVERGRWVEGQAAGVLRGLLGDAVGAW